MKRGLLAGLLLLGLARPAAGDPPPHFVPDWGFVNVWPFPLNSGGLPNPLFDRYDIEGIPTAFVADPCPYRTADEWLLFFELYSGRGKIGLARSENGFDWTFDKLVLFENWHISNPCVFRSDNDYYMVIESGATQSVPLYKATDFPYGWEQVATLATGRAFADPIVFYWNGSWWMFVSYNLNDECYLYFADDVLGPWQEHPLSPVVTGSSISRPAGRVVHLMGSRLLRIAQDDNPTYGEGVRAFEIDLLTRTEYAEHPVAENPILFKSGSGWNARGMHTCNLWWADDRWIALVDGMNESGMWSIGVYLGRGETSGAETAGGAASWRASPNPFRIGSDVRLVRPAGASEFGVALEVFAPTGARLFSRRLETLADFDAILRAVAGGEGIGRPGVYLLRYSSPRGELLGSDKVVALR